MKTRILQATALSLLVIMCLAVPCIAISKEVDEETSLALDKVKSPDAAIRAEAVRELVGVREAVAEELKRIVSEANQNPPAAHPAAKASAILDMGQWGLVQCTDVFEAEKDWRTDRDFPTPTDDFSRYHGPSPRSVIPNGFGRAALQYANVGGGVRPKASGQKADLSKYPALKKAFSDLRSYDNETFLQGQRVILDWYVCITQSLENMVTFNKTHLYSDDVKVSAIYLAGEYRILHAGAFFENIDLRDEKGQTAGYPSALTVNTVDSEYPAAVAMVKCGRRMDFKQLVGKMAKEDCSQPGRERIARAMMTIDPQAAKTEMDKFCNDIRARASSIPDNAGILSRLSSVAGIIK